MKIIALRPPARRPARRCGLLAALVLGVALPATALGSTPPTKKFPNHTGTVVIGTPAPVVAKPPPVLAPVAKPSVPDEVESTGSDPQFQSTWGGVVNSPDGTITAYVTAAGKAGLEAALQQSVGPPSVGYHVVTVARSYSDLDALTSAISGDEATLRAEGIDVGQWGPDVASNTVKIQLDNYTPALAQAVQAHYGSAVSVVPSADPGLMIQPATRQDDTSPWFDGDPLFYNGNRNDLCTLGFAFIGNNSGREFNATDGHCGPNGQFNTSYPHNYILGHTSTNYWTSATSTDDIQSISTGGAFSYEVWYSDTATHNVIGWGDFRNPQLVTMDGYTTDEQPDWTVQNADQCYDASHWSDHYERCHIWDATNSSRLACYQGDSGGPVYQRTSNNNVYAAGLIIGGETGDNHHCYYYGIGPFRSLVNGHLMTVSGSGG